MNPYLRTQALSSQETGSDLLLVRRALEGEREAVEGVLSRLACTVRFVFRLNRNLQCGLPTEALEDVVQQVYTTVWTRLSAYSGNAALESWVFGFCRNCLRAELRRRSKRLRLLRNAGPELSEVVDQSARPDGQMLLHEGLNLLHEELEKLSPEEQSVVKLRHLEDWSFERIARHLDLPASTVKDRCYRALLKMRGGLGRRDVSA
ncbi:MAG: RNA polymerase sigma factor [Planctomycetota bacterium]|jgi:RNA polymerase sigma-70 factor (ECF subfamily)